MDVHVPEVRSYNMSQIRSRDTKPEMIIRKFLHEKGFRYRLCVKNLPGKPDIVLPKYRVVIFVNGCFWHGHNKCKSFRFPKSRISFWKEKIEKTIENDLKNYSLLTKASYRVIVIWECTIKSSNRNITLSNLLHELNTIRNR